MPTPQESRRWVRVKGPTLADLLDQISARPDLLGRRDRKRALDLAGLFEDTEEQPLPDVCAVLRPDTDDPKKRNDTFRQFKKALNRAAAQTEIPVRMVSPSDNTPPEQKTVWFETCLDFVEITQQIDDRDGGLRPSPVYDEGRFVSPSAASKPLAGMPGEERRPEPVARVFPTMVEGLLSQLARKLHLQLRPEAVAFLQGLAIKLEPIQNLDSPNEGGSTVGFECLALGPQETSYWPTKQAARELGIEDHLLDLVLVRVALETVHAFTDVNRADHEADVLRLFFTINFPHDLLDTQYADALHKMAEQYQHVVSERVVFEITEGLGESAAESLSPEQEGEWRRNSVEEVLAFASNHGLSLALDDHGNMAPYVRGRISDYMNRQDSARRLAKLDWAHVQDVLDVKGADAQAALDEFGEWVNQDWILVVEGIEDRDRLAFLRNRWPRGFGKLYGQGYALSPSPPWARCLTSLAEYGQPGGYVLVAQSGPRPRTFRDRVLDTLAAQGYHARGRVGHAEPPLAVYTVGEGDRPVCFAVWEGEPDLEELQEAFAAAEERLSSPMRFVVVREPVQYELPREAPEDRLQGSPPEDHRALLYCSPEQVAQVVELSTEAPDRLEHFLLSDPRIPAERYEWEIPATGRWEGEGSPSGEAIRLLLAWLATPRVPTALVLGDYGTGKTFTLRKFARDLLQRHREAPSSPIPLYVDLRDVRVSVGAEERGASEVGHLEAMLEDYLTHKLRLKSGMARVTLDAVAAGQVVLLLDGFDEKAAHLPPRAARTLWSELISAARSPESKLVVSCRTHYFRTPEEERREAKGEGEDLARDPLDPRGVRILYLEPFDRDQIRKFLAKACGEEEAGRLEELIDGIHDLPDLARRPVLLDLIVRGRDALEGVRARRGRIGAGALYETYAKSWLGRDKHKTYLEEDLKLAFTELAAKRMWEAGGHRPVPAEELRRWLRDTVSQADLTLGLAEGEIADADARTATFVCRADGGYTFTHRSFLEFFVARAMARGLTRSEPQAIDLPQATPEVAGFVLDLVEMDRDGLDTARRTLEGVLEGPYRAQISENGAVLTAAWQRRDEQGGPRPAAFHLERARLAGADLSRVRWPEAQLPEADLQQSVLTQAVLPGANLRGANLEDADAGGSDFCGADLEAARLVRAVFEGAKLADANLSRCVAIAADLTGSDLSGADLTQGALESAGFVNATLERAVWTDASLLASRPTLQPPPAALSPALALPMFVGPVAYSHDGRWLAVGQGGRIILLDAVAGWPVCALTGHEDTVYALAFSRDGGTLASGSGDKTVRLWDMATGQERRRLTGHESGVSALAFSPDGDALASSSWDHTVYLWDWATGQEQRRLTGHEDSVYAIAFSPDGRTLASGSGDRTVRLWHWATGQERRRLAGHQKRVEALAFSPDGKTLASGSEDKTVLLWEGATGRERRRLTGHEGRVCALAFSPDGETLASGSWDKTIRLWDGATGRKRRRLAGHQKRVEALAFSPDGKTLASGSLDKTVRLWDRATGRERRLLTGHEGCVSAVAFSPDGRTLAASSWDSIVRLWGRAAGRERRRLTGHGYPFSALAFGPDGRPLAAGLRDNTTVHLWNGATDQERRLLTGHGGLVGAFALSPDGRILASGSRDKTVRLWDVATGQERRRLTGHQDSVYALAFSPDGRFLASGSGDETVRLWDETAGQERRLLTGHGCPVSALAFSPDGKAIASGTWGTVLRLWDVATGRERCLLTGHDDGVHALAFSPDGKTLASGSEDNTVRLWDVATGQERRLLTGHEIRVSALAFSPDGRTLASGSLDQTVRLWDTRTGECSAALVHIPAGLVCLYADGRVEGDESALREIRLFAGEYRSYSAYEVKLMGEGTPIRLV